jgi:hypothetical protein
MPRVGFKPTTQVFERAKTVHASDRVATVIGEFLLNNTQKFSSYLKRNKLRLRYKDQPANAV